MKSLTFPMACSWLLITYFIKASNLLSKWITTFGNRCLSAIGGEKQRSRLAGWVQLSMEAAPGPHGVPPSPPGPTDENIVDAGNLHE